jgi:hypothetical protein
LLNFPVDRTEYPTTSYYVHGWKFKEKIKMEEVVKKKFMLEPALLKLLPHDAFVRHSRN